MEPDEFARLTAEGRRIGAELQAASVSLRAVAAAHYRQAARIAREYLHDQVTADVFDAAAEADGW